MINVKTLPKRDQVKKQDTWDLCSLFTSDANWEREFKAFQKKIAGLDGFRGRLSSSAKVLAECLKFDSALDRQAERLGTYAFLRTTEDQGEDAYQRMLARFQNVATRAAEAGSFIRPEIMAIGTKKIEQFLASNAMKPYRLLVQRLRRYKPHTLGPKEEQLLAMQGEMALAAGKAFQQLLHADLKFGSIKDEDGQHVELSNATFGQFLVSPRRSVRRKAFHQYYEQFTAHENTLAATLNGSIQKDVFHSRARAFASSLDAALFPDHVPRSVYDNLIAAVRQNLPAVHRYYELRRRKMRLREIHHYDTYVPILSGLKIRQTWKQAVNRVVAALKPLGDEYCSVLEAGLNGRWCDRYPNQRKQSGAFSCGTYDGDPYILMNYKPQVLDDVFTLAHEAGHSMHSYYSAIHQPFEYYNYVIFVAEVASTFNEQLLSNHLMSQARDDRQRAYLINREIDGIRATIIRQTMFAEFEKVTHEMAESGEPLTVRTFRDVYRNLLRDYFGPEFTLDDELSLECLRIPHFYRAFYVYKYATGLSAAIALSHRVLNGGSAELRDYLKFLKGGCSEFPLDLLRAAGVDMESRQPVDTALAHFDNLVAELDGLRV